MAVRLVYSEKFQRVIRLDDPEDIGRPTQNLIEEALSRADKAEALELLRYLIDVEFAILRQSVLGGWLGDLVEFMLEKRGCSDLQAPLRVPATVVWEAMFQAGAGIGNKVQHAIETGKDEDAVLLLEAIREMFKLINDMVVRWVQDILAYVGDTYGEEQVAAAMRVSYDRIWIRRYEKWEELTPLEQLALSAEGMRTHFGGPTRRGEFQVVEEEHRYVMFFDPCGTGGVMRRGDPETGGKPWETTGLSKEAYPWTWGKKGVHWYCAHCNLYLEHFAAETYGYPIRPLGHNIDHKAPCKWFIYKDKSLIPRWSGEEVADHDAR